MDILFSNTVGRMFVCTLLFCTFYFSEISKAVKSYLKPNCVVSEYCWIVLEVWNWLRLLWSLTVAYRGDFESIVNKEIYLEKSFLLSITDITCNYFNSVQYKLRSIKAKMKVKVRHLQGFKTEMWSSYRHFYKCTCINSVNFVYDLNCKDV